MAETQPSSHSSLKRYLVSSQSYWFWAVILLTLVTSATVFLIPENAYPFVYARYIFGSIFILFLPGYSLIKALFPKKGLDILERIALSVGMSLALVPVIVLMLNYTPWGISPTTITLGLLTLTITLATVAIIRTY